MEIKRPLLLISNDDGYQAKGINCLVEMLKDITDIIVCAPDDARSGYSCAFSAGIPLRLNLRHKEEGVEVWSCNGTPVDCVKMALANICERQPDMVIGGINHGDNASVNTHYSGTMGVVIEGCLKYIPSVAFSLCDQRPDADFSPLKHYVREVVQRVLAESLPKGVCLNVNFPLVESYAGVKVCRMAFGTWYNECSKYHHPRGYDYWWMVGHYRNDEPDAEDTDNWALRHGYIAITPTQIDVTAYRAIEQIKNWQL
ncbi:5'/3'-nucleotidase SurE [Prevotella sp. P6B4]|uniref:5'/3'-nucleotidase SurE n=1 Tax=Prevotella sp. P6B4 TaxID=1410614 RepID=UPI00048C7623|nr:5'/3'-nucleotidase SurE [Prevotella sp. P6B4]